MQIQVEKLFFVTHDMAKQGDWKRVIEVAIAAYDRIDVLFNNAGLYKVDSVFFRSTRERFQCTLY